MRGKLVVFEGLDRSGKSTQCARLVDRLRAEGHDVHQTRFPDRTTPIGRLINDYLTGTAEQEDHVIHLLFSANRWEAVNAITARLAANTTVVVDRYYYSGVAYTAAKANPTLSAAWARGPDVGLPRPDVCVFLDVGDGETMAGRAGFGDERYERAEFQRRVRDAFEPLLKSDEVVRVDASQGIEEVAERVWAKVSEVFDAVDREERPVGVME